MLDLIKKFGGEVFTSVISKLDEHDKKSNYIEYLNNTLVSEKILKRSPVISKVSVLKDYETKSRVIAILDYFSQSVLIPLHKGLFSILKTMETDQTFGQTKGLTELRPDPMNSFHSIDLTAATDRFPVSLQVLLLSKLIGPERAAI